MRLGTWAPLLCLAVATVSLPVLAQPPRGGAGETLTEDQAKAKEHYRRAEDLYHSGRYSDAISELEIARKLDPKAKELVMNLGIVHEKLARYEEALVFFKSYLEMEGVTPAERSKVEGFIKRIEGVRKEAPKPSSGAAPSSPPNANGSSTPAPAPTSSVAEEPPHGRIDGLTIGAGAVAIVGLAAGAGLGIYALTSRPDNFVTGRDGSYADLQQKTDDAHTFAIVADVGLAVGVIAAAITAYLYFGRTKDPSTGSGTGGGGVKPAPTISAGGKRSGGILFLGGAF
jgi:hypothetical protein